MKNIFQSRNSDFIRLVIFILAVFSCEAIIMAFMPYLFQLPLWGLIFLDASLLIILLLPGLYFFLYRPMDRRLRERGRVLEALGEQERSTD